MEASIEGASPGAKTITLSGTMEMILSDQAYQDMADAEEANSYSWIKIAATDSKTTATTETIYVGGYITQLDRNYNQDGPSDVSITFRANEFSRP